MFGQSSFLTFLQSGNILFVDTCKLFHLAHRLSVLRPLYFAVLIPIPYVGNNEIFLFSEITLTVNSHLATYIAASSLIAPFHIISIYIDNHISIRCTASVNPSAPPCTACSTNVVFIQIIIHDTVLQEMRVAGEYMYVVSFENLSQLL